VQDKPASDDWRTSQRRPARHPEHHTEGRRHRPGRSSGDMEEGALQTSPEQHGSSTHMLPVARAHSASSHWISCHHTKKVSLHHLNQGMMAAQRQHTTTPMHQLSCMMLHEASFMHHLHASSSCTIIHAPSSMHHPPCTTLHPSSPCTIVHAPSPCTTLHATPSMHRLLFCCRTCSVHSAAWCVCTRWDLLLPGNAGCYGGRPLP